jgi:hypothetical protein
MVLAAGACLLWLHLARQGFLNRLGEHGRLLGVLALLATPFLLIGVSYYPSDAERWLFLMPLLWLVIGLAWDQATPAPGPSPGRRIVAWDSPVCLGAIVLGLGTYNAAALLPDTLANRGLAGLKALAQVTTGDDLVISAAGLKGRINEFYLDRPIAAENLTVMGLVKAHGADLRGMQADLAGQIDRTLHAGRRVFVFGLIGERLEKQRGYPWTYIEHGYGPETFLDVLEHYEYDPISPPGREQVGIIRLGPKPGS